MRTDITTGHPVPRWLRFVMVSDRAGSSWYVGTGFFFAPLLAVVSPWPTLTTVLWVLIALAGLWLGLLGIAMATGLAVRRVRTAMTTIRASSRRVSMVDCQGRTARPSRSDCFALV